MKKFLGSMLLIAILINFIFQSVCFATTDDVVQEFMNGDKTSYDTFMDDIFESNSNGFLGKIANTMKQGLNSIVNFTINYTAGYVMIFVVPLQLMGALLTYPYQFTIENILFNRIAITNINYFNYGDNYTIGPAGLREVIILPEYSKIFRNNIAKIYNVSKIIAVISSLMVLIYIGIKMALSTVASDKAKYKKMIVYWLESFILIFALPYIMVIIINFGELITNVFFGIYKKIRINNFEFVILNDMKVSFEDFYLTMEFLRKITMYCVLIYVQLKFLFMYIKRALMLGFLIVISPFIKITYSIDKSGDGKPQAFNKWIFEFLINVFIQPIHTFIYLVFMSIAGGLIYIAPILGIVFVFSLGAVEKNIRRLLNSKKAESISELGLLEKKSIGERVKEFI